MRFQADAVRNYGRLQGAKENNMNEDYPTKTTDEERTNRPDLGAAAPLDEQPRPVPTNTFGVYAQPQGVSMISSKAVPFIITAFVIIGIVILVVWLW